MSRILSIGNELEFATKNCNWSERPNIKDFDYVFMDIAEIDRRFRESDADYLDDSDEVEGFKTPESKQVSKAIWTETTIIATLPQNTVVPKGKRTGHPGVVRTNYFGWLPGTIGIEDEEGSSINPDSIEPEMSWYFSGSEFKWHLHFPVSTVGEKDIEVQPLVTNNFNRATSIKIKSTTVDRVSPGEIYLIPLLDSWEFEDFAQNVLKKTLGEGGENNEGDQTPEWTSKYTLPNEERALQEIEQTKEKINKLEKNLNSKQKRLEDIREYKVLLYGGDSELEDVVPRVFREFGFDVEGEIPHGRDGLIEFENKNVVIETTGTTGGAKKEKARQLDDWVEELMYHNPNQDYVGMLVINPYRRTDPEDRDEYLHNHVENYMKQRGYKVISTETLFNMFVDYKNGELDSEEIKKQILSDGVKAIY
mgnify:CR=1 FL=1